MAYSREHKYSKVCKLYKEVMIAIVFRHRWTGSKTLKKWFLHTQKYGNVYP